jgi:hypothetical protein
MLQQHGLGLDTFFTKKFFKNQKTENGLNFQVDFHLPDSAETSCSFFEIKAFYISFL